MAKQYLQTQKEVAAIQYAVLGTDTYTSDTAFDTIMRQLNAGTLTEEQYIQNLLNSTAGKTLYSAKSNLDIVKSIYTNLQISLPSDESLSKLITDNGISSVIDNAINSVINYSGFDEGSLAAQNNLDDVTNGMMFKDYGTDSWIQWSNSLNNKENLISSYIALAGRTVDINGLRAYTSELVAGTKSLDQVLLQLINSKEFQGKGTALSGNDFISHVYSAVYGTAPSDDVLAKYSALGTDKVKITEAIINDLQNSTATDATSLSEQHDFAYQVGSGLLYKTSASLTSNDQSGNATSTVNTGSSHILSNAETSTLQTAKINLTGTNNVDLTFAEHLKTSYVQGNGTGNVYYAGSNITDDSSSSTTTSNTTVDENNTKQITMDNAYAHVFTGTGNTNVALSNQADLINGTGSVEFGSNGSLNLTWAGNANSNNGINQVGNFTASGGDGTDTISANLITKNVTITKSGIFLPSYKATITTNADQFTNFDRLDLVGYIGKANVSTSSSAADHTFDFGILTGNATAESSLSMNSTQQAEVSTFGDAGLALSGYADNVNVINLSGNGASSLYVTGDATSQSQINLTFLQNATDHFDFNFNADSDSDVNAGSVTLNTSSSILLGTSLTDINISSGGTGSFTNELTLNGNNSQAQNITITGDHQFDLTLNSGFSNVRDIDASNNTAGISLDSAHGGTGDGILVKLLNTLPLSAATNALVKPVLNTLGLNGYQLNVEGTTKDDSFSVIGNTTIDSNGGNDVFNIKQSTISAGVTISNFDATSDKIIDVTGSNNDANQGLTISGDSSGTAIADYGVRSTDVINGVLGSLLGSVTSGAAGLLGGILGLSNSNALTSKVGIASVAFSSQNDTGSSYLIIDENNDHKLDANDTVVYLTGQSHQQLVDTLHYA